MTGTAELGMQGHAPIVTVTEIDPATPISEQRKYERMWERSEYRNYAPGEQLVAEFLHVAHPERESTIIDFGAGTGRGALLIAALSGGHVTMLDFAGNCLDESVKEAMRIQHVSPDSPWLQFKLQDLTHPIPHKAKYGYCTDVMEHIPTADVPKVLGNILMAAEHVFFQISCVEDGCGTLIGHVLHHTVQPYEWWYNQLASLGCVVHHSRDDKTSCVFYVSAWQNAKRFVETGELNVTEELCLQNMRHNLTRGLKEVAPHLQNDLEVVLLAGGPSLEGQAEEIHRLRDGGAKLITVNNTYKWAIEHGLLPSAQVMVDARAHNARFVEPVVDTCKYLMASQVHPSVLDKLPAEQTYLWHTGMESSVAMLNERKTPWYPVPTGSSVVLRAFSLLLMLGYHKFHVFGFDSCLEKTTFKHHAYDQPENDGQMVIPITCGTRVFHCHPWMVSQAEEFQNLMKVIGDHVDVIVYGDGLISAMVDAGYKLALEREIELT